MCIINYCRRGLLIDLTKALGDSSINHHHKAMLSILNQNLDVLISEFNQAINYIFIFRNKFIMDIKLW